MSVVNILEPLIRYNTTNPPGNEAELAGWIAAFLASHGFEIDLPSCGENRKSVVARLKMGQGPKIVLNGHLDVVPPGDGWDTDPFCPVLKDGRVYGRGSADMKGGVAAMIQAGVSVAAASQKLCGELCLVFVADEEILNLGTISCREGWLDAGFVVIGEPTGLQIEIAHKGTARFEITVEGKSCHSSMPWNGVNAIEKMAKVIHAMEEYDASLRGRAHPLLSRPSIAVTTIGGGEKDNIIPGSCTIRVDYRMIPGDTGQAVEERLCGYLAAIKAKDAEFQYSIRRYINLEPGEIPADHPFVRTAGKVYEEKFGASPVVRDFPASCEQVLFVKEGIPALVFGPGSIEQAHVANEFVEIWQLEEAAGYYEALVRTILERRDDGRDGKDGQ